ncbi:GIY-YIG nuclease family protein [Fimbriiglobus ruber]|uniref:Excinuclease ABC subunit C n=1 Tax=Fimbriiglobus ruber TaxID=1908690 RepID=A0A225DEL1_9BACT|nr:GIY-YIG nuclease family protein [Fimbriiglobus ruber]OWK34557.1 Excinuclease ABC subunit C [Fimbriiglobus ruber]
MSQTAQDGPNAGLFDTETFAGFGASRFRPTGEIPTGRLVRAKSQAKLKHGVRTHAPRLPGVYSMLDAKGRVIYVGKAKNLRARLLSYFRTKSRDPKAGKILGNTRVLVWEQTADEFSALLRELELIRRFRPRFNVIGQPGQRRYVYFCLGRQPAPYAYITPSPTGKEIACYGPLKGRAYLEDAVRRVNDWFKLRDCPATVAMVFADQPELFPAERAPKCLRFEIATCAGPCAGLCGRREYAAGVRAAKAFLDGRDRTVLKELKRRMTAAAADLQYERATTLRDRLQSLTRLDDRLTFLRTARTGGSFVYPLIGPDGTTVWYLIHHGEVSGALREPRDATEHLAARTMMDKVFSQPPPGEGITDRTVDSVLLVFAWFRKYADEKARLMTKDVALALCPTNEAIETTGSRKSSSGGRLGALPQTPPEGSNPSGPPFCSRPVE